MQKTDVLVRVSEPYALARAFNGKRTHIRREPSRLTLCGMTGTAFLEATSELESLTCQRCIAAADREA